MQLRSEDFSFENSLGKLLPATIDWPVGPPRAFALFAHCFTCSKQYKAAVVVSRALARAGFAVMRFNFTEPQAGSQTFTQKDLTTYVADLVSAFAYVEARHEAPSLLVGHSLGGAVAIAAQRELNSVRAVCAIGAPDVATAVDSLGGKSLLLLHSPHDDIVPIAHAERIYRRIRGRKSFVTLDDSDHLLSKHEDAVYVAGVIAAWGARYLPPSTLDDVEDTEGEVLVEEWDRPYTNRVVARHHVQLGDEPVKAGGHDAGFTPYEYLLAALGTCTSMTLRMYAQRKEWPLDNVSVVLNQEKVHAEDCDGCEGKDEYIHELTREIRMEGDLSTEQRQRLLEIADKCPVHRTLTGEIVVRSRLAE